MNPETECHSVLVDSKMSYFTDYDPYETKVFKWITFSKTGSEPVTGMLIELKFNSVSATEDKSKRFKWFLLEFNNNGVNKNTVTKIGLKFKSMSGTTRKLEPDTCINQGQIDCIDIYPDFIDIHRTTGTSHYQVININ